MQTCVSKCHHERHFARLTLTLRLASSSTGTVGIAQVPLQKMHLISSLHRSPHVLRLGALVLGNDPLCALHTASGPVFLQILTFIQ